MHVIFLAMIIRSLGTMFSSKCSIAMDEISRNSWSTSCALGGCSMSLIEIRTRKISSVTCMLKDSWLNFVKWYVVGTYLNENLSVETFYKPFQGWSNRAWRLWTWCMSLTAWIAEFLWLWEYHSDEPSHEFAFPTHAVEEEPCTFYNIASGTFPLRRSLDLECLDISCSRPEKPITLLEY